MTLTILVRRTLETARVVSENSPPVLARLPGFWEDEPQSNSSFDEIPFNKSSYKPIETPESFETLLEVPEDNSLTYIHNF